MTWFGKKLAKKITHTGKKIDRKVVRKVSKPVHRPIKKQVAKINRSTAKRKINLYGMVSTSARQNKLRITK